MLYGSTVPQFKSTEYTLSYITNVFTSKTTVSLIVNTLEYGGGGAALGLVLGTIFAWFMERTDVPAKKFLRLLPVLPLTLPLVVKGFAWISLFSPYIGLVNIFLEQTFALKSAPLNIYSMAGMIFAFGVGGIPLAYLLMEAAFHAIDPSLEEASRASGAGTFRTLFRVTLPMISPQLLTAFLLLFIIGIENFDYPFLFGEQGSIFTLATQVYNEVNIYRSFTYASAYSLIFMIITFIMISIYLWSVRRAFRFVVVTGKAAQQTIFRLGKWRWGGLAICLGMMFFAFILPMTMIVLISFVPYYTVGGATGPFAVLNLNNYYQMFSLSLFQVSILNSFEVSFEAAVITTLIATVMSYVLVKGKTRFKRILEYIAAVPLAFPGIVYSIGLIWTFVSIPFLGSLYGSIYVMLWAMVIIWLPYSIRFVSSSLVQISDELEEAASVMGSGWLRTFPRIVAPLLKSGIVNSFIYVFADSFRELGAVVLLSTGNTVLMITYIIDLYENHASALPLVCAMSVMMTLILGASILATWGIAGARGRGRSRLAQDEAALAAQAAFM
jgi:iron(III) transport system permease protein